MLKDDVLHEKSHISDFSSDCFEIYFGLFICQKRDVMCIRFENVHFQEILQE